MPSPIHSLTLVNLFFRIALAYQFFSNTSVPVNLTVGCADALLGDVDCSHSVRTLDSTLYYAPESLNRTCTQACATGLAAYESNIIASCVGQTWLGYGNETLPVAIIPNLLRYHYNLTCLTDSGRFCNTVAAEAANAADQDGETGGATAAANGTDPCDLCFIQKLRFKAGSPYYEGPQLASLSLYESKTSSCGVSGYPLVTTELSWWTTTTTAAEPTSTACAGTSYAIRAEDTCLSISKARGIGTAWLLADNALRAFCHDFPTEGDLCLVNTCTTYTVQDADTCKTIAKSANVTESQIKAWNPVINAGCNNLYRLNGTEICIDVPGKKYVAPTSQIVVPSTATSAAPVPTNVAEGTNAVCGEYYTAVLGDYCNKLLVKFSITLKDFVFLNPAINENCTNLYAEEAYCVEPVGDINTYSGRPGYSTAILTQAPTETESYADATYTAPTRTSTGFPLASGTRADCAAYFDGDSFQEDMSSSIWGSACAFAAAVFAINVDDLEFWNSGLGNASLSNCTFASGVQYCSRWFDGDVADPPAVSDAPLPIREGASANCTEYADARTGWTCQNILDTYDLTIAQFYAYNPAVGADCAGMWLGYRYCVRTPDYEDPTPPSTSTTTTAPAAPTATSPVLPGQPANCVKWYTVKEGDSCATVENAMFITHAQFLEWNPEVSDDCGTGFWLGYGYCVGTSDDSPTRSSSVASSTTTTTATPAPSPTQDNNAPSACNRWSQAQEGDYCALFADRNGVTPEQLYEWNSVLGSDGSSCNTMFWATYWYCVGVSASP